GADALRDDQEFRCPLAAHADVLVADAHADGMREGVLNGERHRAVPAVAGDAQAEVPGRDADGGHRVSPPQRSSSAASSTMIRAEVRRFLARSMGTLAI